MIDDGLPCDIEPRDVPRRKLELVADAGDKKRDQGISREEYIKRLTELHLEGVEIIKRKAADYATGSDPFRNFKSSPLLGVSVEKGIVVRMGDKLMRVANLLDKAPEKDNESARDSLLDLANYALILAVWLETR